MELKQWDKSLKAVLRGQFTGSKAYFREEKPPKKKKKNQRPKL